MPPGASQASSQPRAGLQGGPQTAVSRGWFARDGIAHVTEVFTLKGRASQPEFKGDPALFLLSDDPG